MAEHSNVQFLGQRVREVVEVHVGEDVHRRILGHAVLRSTPVVPSENLADVFDEHVHVGRRAQLGAVRRSIDEELLIHHEHDEPAALLGQHELFQKVLAEEADVDLSGILRVFVALHFFLLLALLRSPRRQDLQEVTKAAARRGRVKRFLLFLSNVEVARPSLGEQCRFSAH